MRIGMFLGVQLGVVAIACSAQAEGAKVYSGTFKDAAGRTGPMKCELVAKDAGKWTANFSGENKGSGPNKPYAYSGELSGKEAGANVDFTGEIVVQRQGPYAVTAVLAGDSLKATFKKKDGGGDGSFDLTLAKGDAAAAPAAPKAEEPKVAPKPDAPKAN